MNTEHLPFWLFALMCGGNVSRPKALPVPAKAEAPQPVRLLVVDDDPAICALTARGLKAESACGDWQVECAHSLHETLEHLAEHRMDVILLDLCIGDSDGMETLEKVQRVADGAAIVVMSGLEESEAAPSAMMQGAQDFISKSKMNIRELPQRLCQAIEGKRMFERVKARNKLSDGDSTADTFGACHV